MSKGRLVGAIWLAAVICTAVLLGVAVSSGRADPNLPNVPPHQHWINGVKVGPDICDNPGDPGIQQAFNEFHNNLHVATAASIGPAAPGLHNGKGGEIVGLPCGVTP